MAEYKVQFEVFEGPLDLLLYLVKKQEVDIYEVNLTRIAEQFIQHIEVMRQLDLEVAGEFLLMASTLMYIKSRELLPVDQQVETGEEDEGEDPRWELIRQLVEYKKFKDVSAQLHGLETRQESLYPRSPVPVVFETQTQPLRQGDLTVFDLVAAVGVILKRFQGRDSAKDIFEDRFTVSEKIEHLRQLISSKPSFRFSELFAETTSRTEVVVTFLALLELIRLKQIVVAQTAPFSEIEVAQAPAIPPTPADPPREPEHPGGTHLN